MIEGRRPVISFLIPTLNRGRYVVRAVDSALAAGGAMQGAAVEVVVIDSRSDDGSWELLNERFAVDSRVKLVQNERGLGPTRSWLDATRHATGDFVTFLWSDDYISPDFVRLLLPPLLEGASCALGWGVVRPLDDESPLPVRSGRRTLTTTGFALGYFGLGAPNQPCSPACALFPRAALDQWVSEVEGWAMSTPLRRQIMWRRAIGPDLMLLLCATLKAAGHVVVFEDAVAQFSAHAGSISMSFSRWPLILGYWEAWVWLLTTGLEERVHPRQYRAVVAHTLLTGFSILSKLETSRLEVLQGVEPSPQQILLGEIRQLWVLVRATGLVDAPSFLAAGFRAGGSLLRGWLKNRF